MSDHDEMKRGLFWLGSASAVMRAIDVASLFVVLWLLTQEQIGLAALAWTITVMVEAFNGLGMATALVQRDALTERQMSSAFWYVMAAAVGLTCLVLLSAPLVAAFYDQPALTWMVMVAGSKLLFVGAALVPLQHLNRALRFKEIGAIQTLATGLSALTKITLAASGAGAWSLVIANASHGLFTLLGVLLIGSFRPQRVFAWDELRGLACFGFKALLSRAIFHFYRNMDYLIVGKFFGVRALGVYKVAFDLAMEPAQAVLGVINRTVFPVFSRVSQERARLHRLYCWTLRQLGLMVTPITMFLLWSAPHLLRLIADGKWVEGITAAQVLAVAALLRCLAQMTPQVFDASGHPMLSVYDSLVTMALLGAAFSALVAGPGDQEGFVVIAWGWVIVYPIVLFIQSWMLRSFIPITLADQIASWSPAVTSALIMSLAMGPFVDLSSPLLGISLQLAAGLAAFLFYLRFGLGMRLRSLKPSRVKDASGPSEPSLPPAPPE